MSEAISPPHSEQKQLSHRQIMVIFSGLMLALLLAALDQTIVSTALLTIVNDLDKANGSAEMPWVVTADHGHLQRSDAGPAAGRAGPDHRLHGAADHRQRPGQGERLGRDALGRDRRSWSSSAV